MRARLAFATPSARLPTAYAVGYILVPLRGWGAPGGSGLCRFGAEERQRGLRPGRGQARAWFPTPAM